MDNAKARAVIKEIFEDGVMAGQRDAHEGEVWWFDECDVRGWTRELAEAFGVEVSDDE